MKSYVVLGADRLRTEVEYFLTQDAFAFDTETTGPERDVPLRNRVNWVSLATNGRALAIPCGHPNGDRVVTPATRKLDKDTRKFVTTLPVYDDPPPQMSVGQVMDILKPLFFSSQVKVAHNAFFDLSTLRKYYSALPAAPYADTIVLQWILDENLLKKGLKDLTVKYFGVRYDTENVGKCVEAHPFSRVAQYAYMDAKMDWLLYRLLRHKIRQQHLDAVWKIEMSVLPVVCEMYLAGASIDEPRLVVLRQELRDRLVNIESRIYRAAGRRFNLNSPPQKAEVLFGAKTDGGQGIRPKVLTDGGQKKKSLGKPVEIADWSTGADVIRQHEKNPVVAGILEYQEVSKVLGTYVHGYLGNDEDLKKHPRRIYGGRVHAELVQYGTVTGRFSCRAPNLQNVPRPDTDLGQQIRGLFVAPPGCLLVVADYSQIELVLLAHFSRDKTLVYGFRNGVDAHTTTAAALFQVPAVRVTKDQRQVAKGVNFAVVYGAGPDKVAFLVKCSVTEAKQFMALHQREFPQVYCWKDEVVRECRNRRPPHITTLAGRKRRVPGILWTDREARGQAERQAVNSLIQGSAGDILKTAMVRLHPRLDPGMRLTLSVHDELVIEVPEDDADRAADLVREAMEGRWIQARLNVPLQADIKVVRRWSEAK